jgi:spore germination protein KC
MYMKGWRQFIAWLLFASFLTGCWDRIEMNDLAFVMATAIDEGDNGRIVVSTQLAVTNKMGGDTGQGSATLAGGKESFAVVSAEGRDIEDAIQKLQKKLSRRLFQSHRRVIIFGERLARRGIKDVLDGLTRDPENRLRTFVLVAKGVKGQEILNVVYPFEFVPAEAMRELERSEVGLNLTIRDFLLMNETGRDSFMEVIEPTKKEDVSRSTGEKQYFRVSGTGLFQDQKLVDFLNDEETRVLKAITGRYRHGHVTLSLPGNTENTGNITVFVRSMKVKLYPTIRGNSLGMRVTVEIDGDVHENNTPYDMADPQVVQHVEKEMNQEIMRRFMRTIRQVQNKQLDVLGFGEEIHRQYPALWKTMKKDWKQQFAKMNVALDVHSKIWRTGQTGPPLRFKYGG